MRVIDPPDLGVVTLEVVRGSPHWEIIHSKQNELVVDQLSVRRGVAAFYPWGEVVVFSQLELSEIPEDAFPDHILLVLSISFQALQDLLVMVFPRGQVRVVVQLVAESNLVHRRGRKLL